MIIENIKKYVLIIIGTVSLILGIVGAFVPVLPTTPLILLASFCYFRSSKRLYEWLTNHKVFGKYIRDYVIYKAVKKSAKITAITLLWFSLGLTIYLMHNIYIKFLLFVIGSAVTIHLIRLKVLPANQE